MTVVTLEQVKEYLRYEDTDQDGTLSLMLAGAQSWVEEHTGHLLTEREVTQAVPAFGDFVDLKYFPFVDGMTIAYRDGAGADQEIADAVVVDMGGYNRAYPSSAWPTTATAAGIVLTYTAGYADPETVPQVMLSAICLLVAMNDEERGALGEGKTAVEWLLASFHKPALA